MIEKTLYQKVSHYEKVEIILEIGSVYTRVGFQSDMTPRKIIRTPLSLYPNITTLMKQQNEERPNDINRLVQDLNDFQLKMEEFLHNIFDQEVAINPKDRQIYLIYNHYQQDDITNTIAKILYKKFQVSKITFLLSSVLPLYLTGQFTGIVIDCGFLQTTMSPVYDGFSLLHFGGSIGYGGLDISRNLAKEIILEIKKIKDHQNFLHIITTPEWIEEVKIRIGRILPLFASQKTNEDKDLFQKMQSSSINIPIYGGVSFQMSYLTVTQTITNTLFGNPEEEEMNIAYEFLKVIKQLHKIDVAMKVLKNVVFSGGLVLIPNFLNRFKEEMIFWTKKEFSKLQKVVQEMNITQIQNHPQNLNWVAASMLGQIQLSEKITLNYQSFKDNGCMFTTRSDGFNFIPIISENKKDTKEK